jgi:hypothetical protein
VRPLEWPQHFLTPEHEVRFQTFLTSKQKARAGEPRGQQQRKRNRKQKEPRNEPLLFVEKKKQVLAAQL